MFNVLIWSRYFIKNCLSHLISGQILNTLKDIMWSLKILNSWKLLRPLECDFRVAMLFVRCAGSRGSFRTADTPTGIVCPSLLHFRHESHEATPVEPAPDYR
jgi:hypothetical protein